MKKYHIALAASLLLTPVLSLAASDYLPANFAFDPQALASEGAASVTATTVVYCQSEINAAGAAQRTSCYDKSGNANLVSTTENAMAKLGFSPAQVAGKKVPVRMSYRVAYNRIADEVKVVLIPNLGSMEDRYGRDYSAPQERLDLADWYESYSKASWVNGEVFLGEGSQSRVAATVDEKGKADVIRLVNAERAYERDAKIVKNALRKSRFIPGFVDGKPVPMGYLAAVHYGDEGSSNLAKSK